MIEGVVPALVLNNKDPDANGRILVWFPGLGDQKTRLWARLATPMAHKGCGVYFLPEVGDEVLVAFQKGGGNDAFILGGLWNGKDKPPETNADGQNNVRLIRSRSGHVIRLDDTPGKEKLEITDKSGKLKLTLDSTAGSVTIQSAKDLVLNAPQGAVRISAKQIEIKSIAASSIEGRGGLTLNGAPGVTEIKGSVVNIN